MFQTELGYMMRQEQRKDLLRQAELARRESTDNQPARVSGVAHALLIVPIALVTLASRLIVFSAHTIGHSL